MCHTLKLFCLLDINHRLIYTALVILRWEETVSECLDMAFRWLLENYDNITQT